MTGNSRILNLEFLEIASVALLPRNDAENSRFLRGFRSGRLIHHSHIISISGQSYRLRDKARLLN
nr:hypothetical protein [uncultured Campylobacter sp.]